ncbi:MAG: signal peptide peptidase SppA [Chloroflexi bacterium]|nr:MAG: signal peptide peptidase SppA [Chloroflexota bacterium]
MRERLKYLKTIGTILRFANPFRYLRRGWFVLTNRLRRRHRIDYVLLMLPASMPVFPEKRGWLRRRLQGTPPMSLTQLQRSFDRIADDPRPVGVILHLRGLQMGFADLQTLRAAIMRLRERGKRVVAFAPEYNNASYFLASACDEILMMPGGQVNTTGLRRQAVFLKDALDSLGLVMDGIAISPYKSAFDTLTRSDFSPENREQLEWLLDSGYDVMINNIAAGRGMTIEQTIAMVDAAPHLDHEAHDAGYVDALLNEEGLKAHLDVEHIVPFQRASKILLKQPDKRREQYVALIRVGGLMIRGTSAKPPGNIPSPVPFVGDERTGDITVVQQVRSLMQDDSAAAVILFVDSPGGDALAAEAMHAALTELATDRPLIVYMNNVAASGGYYISTAGRWIVAQPSTITGSIGVIMGKLVSSGLWGKLHINRVSLQRGENADIFSDEQPFTDGQRKHMRQHIERIYDQFVRHVCDSRGMTWDAVDAVGGGRVWTGEQAKTHGLVDELGDLRVAYDKACALANLPEETPLVYIEPKKDQSLAPQLAQQADPAAMLRYMQDGLRMITSGAAQLLMPFKWDE